MHNQYVGRFAPSPSGQLHFGSLVTAVASYLDAKSHNGKWLLRMEDIDEPRCIKGVDKDILTTLEAHGLYWDGDVIYQSQQHARYQAVLDDLLSQEKAYFCTCTRKQIKAMGGVYNGHCRTEPVHSTKQDCAVRLKVDTQLEAFDDVLMGKVMPSNSSTDLIAEDVVLKRRDGLFSYNLVVILDDVFQQVNHVIRGCDLIDVTPLQRAVYHTLGYSAPEYGHVPVAAVALGRKLSKQNRAAPVKNETALDNLVRVMHFLGFSFPIASEFGDIDSALKTAISMWDRKKVVKTPEIIVPQHESTYYSEPL
ncbi:putative glutamyl-tRNA synthetase-relatedprotein [Alteromonas macleodii str. 'Black Sea 11']|nr:putative glutamyl-tRNA synthetase-relatedprotein [Alteromonas macleodii str. 'Black Sea 11']NKW89457.1 tRNA glutamyl-Q(34) synthetase GluQRS [Alteromonadaceae bacterium A_SAG4]NKX18761.1 tRNA glutamyl-Q(34) synthetase GluQRS [Alteromonadaceae bacterium A_SAG5]NKX35636.1 tRNA glutamyl-Q(34) synthetase GluQRS [Alteromonadaceae bacterium A_SAG3]NKX69699.1 tRNA glutamyl-Q(34) synthetase GluQRS [Alteromonadaceae bacterium A_SAG7]